VIQQLASQYPVSVLCQTLGYSRSSYYHRASAREDGELSAAIRTVVGEWPCYGYRRVTAQLRREGWAVNRKRVQRRMRLLGFQAKIKVKRRRTTNSEHPFPRYPNRVQGLKIVRPDQVWVADLTYIKLRQEFIYLAVIMDVFSRSIRGWQVGRNLDHTLTLAALTGALQHGVPEIHHSDQGLQYAATAYVEVLKPHQVQISMAEMGQPTQNGYAERLMRTIKEEEVDLSDYENYHEAQLQLGRFLDEVYQHKRIHSALGYLTPAEFEAQWQAQQTEAQGVV
jgi:putative transposase